MADKNVNLDVNIDVKSNIGPSVAKLKELKKELRGAAAGSDEFKRISAQIRDTEDALQGAKQGADDFMGSLEGASGPLGMAARGLKQVQIAFSTFNGALKASVIGILVAALGGLVAAFSENEKAMKKLQPIFNAFQKILGGIFRAFEPVLDIFVELAMQVLPYITKGIGIFYSSLFALFKFIQQVGLGVSKILKGIFTLDMDSVNAGVKQLKGSLTEAVKAYTDTNKRFEEGTKEQTKIEKEEADKRAEKAKADAEKRKKAADEELARRKADLDAKIALEIDKETTSKEALEKLYEARFQAEIQGQKMTNAQKELLRKENEKKVEEALKADKDKRQADFDAQLNELKKAGELYVSQLEANLAEAKLTYGDESAEARKAQDEIFVAKQKNLENEKSLLEQKKELTAQEIERIKSIAIEEQNLTTAVDTENKRRITVETAALVKRQEEAKKVSDARYAQDVINAGNDLALQQQLLDEKIAQDKLYYDTLLANANLTAEQRKAIEDQQTANTRANAAAQVDIEKKKFDAQMAMLDATANAITAVADIVGKNTVAGKALAVASSLISTYSAIAKQLAAFAGVPVPGYAIVQAVATGLVGFKAVRDIISTPVPADAGGGNPPAINAGPSVGKPRGLAKGGYVSGYGSGTSDSIPAMLSNGESVINAASTAMFRPLLSTINQIGGGRKFAQGGIADAGFSQSMVMTELTNALSSSQQAPIKTYVLSSDVSNQLAMERAIKSRSTI
jgi:hypothetical protein